MSMITKVIRKSNDLVEGQYSLTIWEMRIFLKMISMIYKDDTDFKEYRIEIGDFIKEFGLEKNKNAYGLLRQGASGLLKKIVILNRKLEDGTTEQIETPLVTGIAHNIDTKSYIKLSFHPAMKPFLIELKDKFLMYDVKNVLNLPSSYSIRMYEIAKQYARIGKRTLTVRELKKMLDLEGKYERYTHLKQKILTKCISDINANTDIEVDFSEIKRGRKVEKICLHIKMKNNDAKGTPEKETENAAQEVRSLLKSIGVSKNSIDTWCGRYAPEYIFARITYMEEQTAQGSKIKNKAGYLSTIMDKELSAKKQESREEVTKKVNSILFSRHNLQKQIEAKHGNLSQEALNAVVVKMFPERF